MYTCRDPAAADACALASPASPETDPNCVRVDRWARGGGGLEQEGLAGSPQQLAGWCLAPAVSPDRRLSPCAYPPPAPRSIQQSLGLSQNLASSGEAVRNAAILLAFFAFFRVAVYIVLRRKTARM